MRVLVVLLIIFSSLPAHAGWRFSQPKGKFNGICSLENSIYLRGKGRISFVMFYYNRRNEMNPVLSQIGNPRSLNMIFAANRKKVNPGQAAELAGPDLDRDYADYREVEFRRHKTLFYTVLPRIQKIILDNLKFGNDIRIMIPLKKHGPTQFTVKPFDIPVYKKFVQCMENI